MSDSTVSPAAVAAPVPLLIAGAPAPGISSAPVRFPWDGTTSAMVAQAGAADVDAALAAAAGALSETAALPRSRRAAILADLAGRVEARGPELADLLLAETGKTVRETRLEVQRAVGTLRFCAEAATRTVGEMLPLDAMPGADGRIGMTVAEPAGVVAGIPAFNFPLLIAAHKLGPAIGAGCPIVIKPPDQTPLAILALAEEALAAGWPAAALSVLPGPAEVARLLTEDPRVALVSFTGSSAVGRHVARQSALKRLMLELGSNAATIVLADGNLDWAVERCAAGGYGAAGQSCISVQRLYVARERHAELVERLAARVGRLTAGDPRLETTDVGPVIDDGSAERIEAVIADAVEHGARIVVGGGRDGRLVQPTLLDGLTTEMRLQREEIFGPVVAVAAVDSLDEAIALANDSPYGLAAGVFTDSLDDAWRAVRDLQAGNVHVNEISGWRADHMPYGGVKDSGYGKEGPAYAMAEMTHFKTVSFRTRG
jgi:acyl-CoA reductase-like NAD-dependent aldehyde dehydrogenase